jgi:hypothetical protein
VVAGIVKLGGVLVGMPPVPVEKFLGHQLAGWAVS